MVTTMSHEGTLWRFPRRYGPGAPGGIHCAYDDGDGTRRLRGTAAPLACAAPDEPARCGDPGGHHTAAPELSRARAVQARAHHGVAAGRVTRPHPARTQRALAGGRLRTCLSRGRPGGVILGRGA